MSSRRTKTGENLWRVPCVCRGPFCCTACSPSCLSPIDDTDRLCRVFERDGAQLVVDQLSLEYVKGATVDFTVEMIGETFEVRHSLLL